MSENPTSEDIDQLAADYWEALMVAEPTWRHLQGELTHVGDFESAGRQAEDEHVTTFRDFAERAAAVPTDGLSDDQRVTRETLIFEAGTRADLLEARLAEHAADPVFGMQASLPVVAGMLGVPDATVAEAMLTKAEGVGRYFTELAERQREGVAAGRVSPAFAVQATIEQLDALLATPVAEDPVLTAINLPEEVDAEDWRRRFAQVLEEQVRPGLAAYRDVLRDEVLPVARPDDRVGLTFLPGGDDAYARTLRFFTTTDKTPQEIHQIGLDQIAALADEYRALGPEVAGTDDLQGIFDAMRTDPALHFKTGEELVEQSRVAMARAWEAMPDWFETLPKAPCAVEGVTTGAKAYYFPPAADGSRGGTFFINIDDPTSWGIFELESLAFHEGIPGHHLQLTIASELPDSVPAIRRYSENAAYAEGWGLYTERLADEMGLYSSQVQRLGMLSADSLRACRLVVDTGLHALGWSRQQAIDYMVENSPMTEGICRPEVDRYIVSPGQACSYMIGRLEIQRMRAEAESREGFEIKKFHSAVLDGGALPLNVLDQVVRARV
ncbi:DUF885 domain-containing protein [Enemella evansiae]|uniref:DUF885 domain-containing protein n=1 Tax=Enemella evansiae TaxID=2016499 RepID=UPI001E4455E4|nr:DUF885 domain-containing protein [Enemella evansiae]